MFIIDKMVISFIDSMRKRKIKAGLFILILSLFVTGISFGDETDMVVFIPYKNTGMGEGGAFSCLYQPLIDSSDSRPQELLISNKPQKYEIGGVGLIHNHSQHPEESFREYLPGISYGKQIVKK